MDLSFLAKFVPKIPWVNPNGADWFFKFAPKAAPPTEPQTAPVTPPAPVQKGSGMQVYEAILSYNNGLSLFKILPKWVNPIKGVTIDKIDEAQALAIATRIKPSAEAFQLPLTYVMACLAIESVFDPNCVNQNIGPGESNTANDPLGYDVGIGQLKLRYLISEPHSITNADEARAFAVNVDQAIPYHCSLMATKVIFAKNVIEQSQSKETRLNNPLMLATAAYNFGNQGVLTYFESGQFPSHCQHVLDLERLFAKDLGVESAFPSDF